MHLRHASKCMYTCKYMLTHSRKHVHTNTLSHTHWVHSVIHVHGGKSQGKKQMGWGGGTNKKHTLGYLVLAVCPICAQSIATTVTHRLCQNKNIVHRPFDTKISVKELRRLAVNTEKQNVVSHNKNANKMHRLLLIRCTKTTVPQPSPRHEN